MIQAIAAVADDAERISLYRLTIRKLAFDDWKHRSLDLLVAISDAAIQDCERLGGDYLEQANVLCFNSSANLADCWADGFHREPRHFRKGLEYAEKALWYREHLGKGPGSVAMATWALAKHQQSLGHAQEAREAYRRCLKLEIQAAHEAGKPAELTIDAPSGLLIAAGYVALMDDDRATLVRLDTVLRKMLDSGGEAREEAAIVVLQLRETARHMGRDLGALFAADAARSV